MVKKERDHETQIRRIRSVLRFVYVSKLSFLLWQTQALANEIRTVCCVFSTKIYNRLVKLQNYVRRSESRQALDLGGVFSLRFFENLLVRGPVSIFYRSSDFISDSMRSLRTVSLQRWGWKWVAVVSYLIDLFDSYVQEQLTLSLFNVISAGPGKERTPNGQVSKWEGAGTRDREQGAGGSMIECSDSLYRLTTSWICLLVILSLVQFWRNGQELDSSSGLLLMEWRLEFS